MKSKKIMKRSHDYLRMKPGFLFCLLFVSISLFNSSKAFGSDSLRYYNVYIKTLDKERIKGRLLEVNTDNVLLYNKKTKTQQRIFVQDIKRLRIKRKGNALRGTLIGLGVATAGLVIAGNVVSDDSSGGGYTGLVVFLGALIAVPATLALSTTAGGVLKKGYLINGKVERFDQFYQAYKKRLHRKKRKKRKNW